MDDTIRRQVAIEAIEKIDPSVAWLDYAVDVIKALPPAQSELEDKIREIGYTGKEGRIYIGGRLFAVRELPQ